MENVRCPGLCGAGKKGYCRRGGAVQGGSGPAEAKLITFVQEDITILLGEGLN